MNLLLHHAQGLYDLYQGNLNLRQTAYLVASVPAVTKSIFSGAKVVSKVVDFVSGKKPIKARVRPRRSRYGRRRSEQSLYKREYLPVSEVPETMAYRKKRAKRKYGGRKRKVASYKRKRKCPKTNRGLSKTVAGLSKIVKNLNKQHKLETATCTRRVRATSQHVGVYNQQDSRWDSLNTLAIIEAALANLQYYDPSDPATPIAASGVVGEDSKKYQINNVQGRQFYRNNAMVPVKLRIYICTPKVDTSFTGEQAWEQGLANLTTTLTKTCPLVKLRDSDQFTELWRVKQTHRVTLLPGQEYVVHTNSGPFVFDPSLADNHNLGFQTRLKACGILTLMEGVCGHSLADDQDLVGTLPYAVDLIKDTAVTITYDAGADFKTVVCVDGSDMILATALTGVPVIPDNIALSLT